MREVIEQARDWAAGGEGVALAVVVGSRRSAPRPLGTKMAISSGGMVSGAVSGGCVEGAVAQVARELIDGAPPRLVRFGYTDEEAWDVGLQCGGAIDVWVEAGPPDELTRRFADLERDGAFGALVTEVEGRRPGGRALVTGAGVVGASLELSPALVEDARRLMYAGRSATVEAQGSVYFVDATAPPPRLLVFGAVDYAAALCTAARVLGWHPYVIDPRGFFAQPSRFPDAEGVIAAWPQEGFAEVGGIDRATAIVVLTHDPKLDDAALRIALASEAFYVGAMGSRNAQADRRRRLLEAGVPEAGIKRIAAPVGLDLGAETAGETALSIMAEIVAVRKGRQGGRLADAEGRIHVAPRD